MRPAGRKVIRMGFDLRGDSGEREVINMNETIGMGNRVDRDKRGPLSCWSVCLSSAPGHCNPSYLLIQLNS